MKILFLVAKEKGGGAEEVTRHWIKFLNSRGHSISVVKLAESGVSNSGTPQGVSRLAWGEKSVVGKIASLRRFVRSNEIDMVVSVLTFQNIIAIFSLMGMRSQIVISEHNVPSILLLRQRLSQRLQYVCARILYRRAAGCIAVSHAVASNLRCTFGVKEDRLAVLPNAVTTQYADVSDKPGRSEISIDREVENCNRIHLLIPARLVDQKSPRIAIQIARTLIDRGYETSIDFVGDGPLEGLILRDADEAAVSVCIHRWTDRWSELAQPESVVLLPSTVEGFGNILVHAANSGIPSVASSVALGVGDALVEGITGSLAETYTTDSFCDAIERALKIEIEVAPASWLNRFHVDNVGNQIEKFLLSRGVVK